MAGDFVWTDQAVEALISLHRNGSSFSAIAKMLGTSKSAASNKHARLVGLPHVLTRTRRKASPEGKARKAEQDKALRLANAEKIRGQKAAYRAAHREELNAYDMKWKRENAEKYQASLARRYQRHKDERGYVRPHPMLSREEIKFKVDLNYRTHHAERKRNSDKSYRDKNRDKVLAKSRASAERRAQAEGSCSELEADAIRNLQNFKCTYCQSELTETAEFDHIVPISRGGVHWPSNRQWLCKRCNNSKGRKNHEEYILFLQKIKRLTDGPEAASGRRAGRGFGFGPHHSDIGGLP